MKVSKLSKIPEFDPYSECKYVSAGNSIMIMSSDHWNKNAHIQKIDSERYILLNTGEIKEFNRWENRSEGTGSIRKSIQKLRDLINANAYIPENLLWVTLTYAENMTDVKKLYNDGDKFNKRLKYYLKKVSIDIPEYIAVIEPQSRGAWHYHILFIWNHKAPFIDNSIISKIWGHGFCKTKAVNNVDNLGAYFSAYLCNLPVEECENYDYKSVIEADIDENGNKEKKKFVKGSRLQLYPNGVNLYRTSRGIKKPDTEYLPLCEAQNRVKELSQQYQTAFCLTDEQTSMNITIVKTFYNRQRHNNTDNKGGKRN